MEGHLKLVLLWSAPWGAPFVSSCGETWLILSQDENPSYELQRFFFFNLPLAILLCCSQDNPVGCPGRCRSPLLGLFNSKFGGKWAYWRKPFPGVPVVKNLPAIPETWVWSLGWEDPLEKEMTTHSSILAWEIPWTEEPGGLQSMGLHRVGHNWNDWVETSRTAAIFKKIINGQNGLKKHRIYLN